MGVTHVIRGNEITLKQMPARQMNEFNNANGWTLPVLGPQSAEFTAQMGKNCPENVTGL